MIINYYSISDWFLELWFPHLSLSLELSFLLLEAYLYSDGLCFCIYSQ